MRHHNITTSTRTPYPTRDSYAEVTFFSFLDLFDSDILYMIFLLSAVAVFFVFIITAAALVWYFFFRRRQEQQHLALDPAEEDAIPRIREPLLSSSQPQQNQIVYPTELARQDKYVVYWQARANPVNSRSISVRIDIHPTTTDLCDFHADYRFANGWTAQVEPGNTSFVSCAGPSYTQALYLFNSTGAPFEMVLNISFRAEGRPVDHSIIVKSLPPVQQ